MNNDENVKEMIEEAELKEFDEYELIRIRMLMDSKGVLTPNQMKLVSKLCTKHIMRIAEIRLGKHNKQLADKLGV